MNKSNQTARRIKGLCVLVIFCSFVSLYMSQCRGRPKPDTKPIIEAGRLVADETLKLVANHGSIVVVTMDAPTSKTQLKAFRQTLKQQQNVTLASVEIINSSQLAQSSMGTTLSADYFFKLLEKHSKATAIVSFVGPPLLGDHEIERLNPRMPKLIVFAPMAFGVRKLLEEQVVQVAILPRVSMMPMAHGGTFNGCSVEGIRAVLRGVDAAVDSIAPVLRASSAAGSSQIKESVLQLLFPSQAPAQ